MTPTPNSFAIFALITWPVVALVLYLNRPVSQATLWTIVGAQLLLPAGAFIKFKGVPQLDKEIIPNLAAFVGCLLAARRPMRFWSGIGFAEILIVMSLIGPFITAELNNDPIILPNRILPAESHYDALSAVVLQFLSLLPFFLGRQVLRSSLDNKEILRVLVITGILYSVPMLFEVRMSPQLHNWVYGYFPSDFIQEVRDGGFRPMVFMGHGLLAALYVMMTAVAAAALWRTRVRIWRLPPASVTAYLLVVLLLCKTLGAFIYGAVTVPLVRMAKPRAQLRVAVILATIALFYPVLRFVDLIPTDSITQAATVISEDRARSLKTRFDNEDQLLMRASQRFLFGWGRWGRNRVYDQTSGKDISITDGRWTVTLGQFGLFGFFAEFGLLVLPVFRAASALKFAESADKVYLGALALILAINVFDLLPNSGLMPWTWLMAGALLGRADALRIAGRNRVSIKSFTGEIKSAASI